MPDAFGKELEKNDRLMTAKPRDEDVDVERSIRPRTLKNYIGQEPIKASLSIYLQAALCRRDPLDHILLYGPPGLGKTTLANIIAAEMGRNIRVTSGPAIERPGDLASILTNLSVGDVLFIDEIHRMPRVVEEVLYPAMEDFGLDIMIGKGPSAKSIRLDLPRFTLVGATTRAGLLTAPLRDRFGILFRLELYTHDELCTILTNAAKALDVRAEPDGVAEIARRSRGTPRIANRLLRRVRDYAQVVARGIITQPIAQDALSLQAIDELGLDRVDRAMLEAMIKKFSGGPVGLDTLAAATGEDPGTIEDVYEPFLMQMGFVARTPRGRIALPAAYKHIGLSHPGGEIGSEPNEKPDENAGEQLSLQL
ncbi:MAG: Holliday junction branch migration DNA helicase RuvB [Oscillospiraceae bacterium]|jgi:Holliday junction DNA helicase RuvB|nr:Holliday junction branch migration DNA helicase RuvB [Oscillospiraceae bacterium]